MTPVVAALLFLAGVADALRDLSAEGSNFLPTRFHKSKSWVNKWKRVPSEYFGVPAFLVPNTKPLWYYLWLYNPEYKEAFPYSSTFLIFGTDFWHGCQTLFHICIYLSLFTMSFSPLYAGVVGIVAWRVGFSLMYNYAKGRIL